MNKLNIVGYKSIRDATIVLHPINILIGGNGSGKSNFLSFFEFLNQLYEQKLQNYVALNGYLDKFLHQSDVPSTTLSAKLSFNNNVNAYSFDLEKSDDSFIIKLENLIYQGNEWDIAWNGREASVQTSEAVGATLIRTYLKGLKKYHFHDTGRNAPFNLPSHIENDVYFLYDKGENLAAFLWMIRENHPIHYKLIIKTIQSIAPYFSTFYLEPNATGYLKLQWQDKYSQMVYGATNLSDGTIRFIALAVLFLQPNLPSTIIIDEPELGLHPTAIKKFAGMVQSAVAKGSQVIVATQSVELINHFEPEDIITVDHKHGESQYNRLKKEDLALWLEDYTIGDLWQRNIIQGGQSK